MRTVGFGVIVDLSISRLWKVPDLLCEIFPPVQQLIFNCLVLIVSRLKSETDPYLLFVCFLLFRQ